MTEAEVLRGQELIESIQVTKQVISKIDKMRDADLSDITIKGHSKDSRESSASIITQTGSVEFHLNMGRKVDLKEIGQEYLENLKDHFLTKLTELEEELANLGKSTLEEVTA